ncbi:hypothetical protein TEA_016992 [Camellia sinensis var. sinensis]|uniref:Phytocyanin domain-containing protein n=1 Tax=Camellia sinensis var. sinensis TaxID=542762 RepID=A0A4V3WJ07_CAMSN|nr:hypothetical protein TEA_016992 [Camellia sinensis var. sinensis]
MASNNLLVILAIVAIVLPSVTMATDYWVGDSSGWTNGYDYQAWAKDKVFYVGDKLVFNYTMGNHNVFKVNATGFSQCIIPPSNEALTSGHDIIPLMVPGKKCKLIKAFEYSATTWSYERAVYEELGKYGDLQNQVLYRERVEELEPSIRYCLHKLGESNLQTSELMHIGEMEGPALDLFKAKLEASLVVSEAVMAEARSQQAASMTEFHWLGHKFPISNAKTRVSILKENELDARTKDVENVKLALESLLYEEGQMEALQKDRAAELELVQKTRVNGAVAKLIKVKDGFTMTALEVGKGNAEVALSLVGYDQELKRAMEYVFGSTFVCKTIDATREVSPFQGGGDLLRQLHALAEVESKLSIHQKRLSEIEAELQVLKYFGFVFCAGGGRNVSARKENGVSNSMERGFKPSLSVPEKTKNNANPHVTKSSTISVNGPTHVPYGSSSHERGTQSSAGIIGVYSSTSDPVVVAPLGSQIPSMGAIKCEINSQRIAAESGAFNPSGKRSSKLKESQILEKNQPLEPSEVVASEAPTLAVEAVFQSLPDVSFLEEATSKVDMKLEKLNISTRQPVIFPDHLQVPEDFKNGLIFGSLDATFEESVAYVDGTDDMKSSMPAIESFEGNDKVAKETFSSNPIVFSTAHEGDYPNDPHSPPHEPDNSSPVKNSVSSGTAPEFEQSKQENMLRQSGNSSVSSTSDSKATATQPIGQSSIPISPPPFPVFRQPYPVNYFPFGAYFPPFYLAANAPQFLGHSGFPQQPSTGNVYLSPIVAAAAGPGVKFSVPQNKAGHNAGNLTHFGIPSGFGSYNPSLAVNSGSSAGNEDLTASELKENSVHTTVQQGEGPLVWFPGRDIPSLHANSFYNHIPPGQHIAFSPLLAGHAPSAGIYHPAQTMASSSTARPL